MSLGETNPREGQWPGLEPRGKQAVGATAGSPVPPEGTGAKQRGEVREEATEGQPRKGA